MVLSTKCLVKRIVVTIVVDYQGSTLGTRQSCVKGLVISPFLHWGVGLRTRGFRV